MIGVVRTRQLACKEQVQALLDLNRTEEQSEDRTDHKNVLNDTEFQTPQERCLHSTLEKPCDDDRTSEYEVSVIQWEKNWKTFTDNRAWTESWWDRSRACYDILNPCHNYCLEQVQVPVQERQAKHRAVQEMQISPNGFGKLCGGWRMGQQGAAK